MVDIDYECAYERAQAEVRYMESRVESSIFKLKGFIVSQPVVRAQLVLAVSDDEPI